MGKTVIKNVRVITPDEIIENGYVAVENGTITEVGTNYTGEGAVDGGGRYLSPGFVDIHIHGGGGSDFMDGTALAYHNITNAHVVHGTTSMLPTPLAAKKEELVRAIEVYKEAKKDETIPCNLLGMHFEGPYVSKNQAGALDPRYLKNPTKEEYEELVELSGSDLVRWSIAPELDGALEFGDYLKERGILPTIAHSDATYEEVAAAFEHGFTHVTHLYSATSTIVRKDGFRHAGIIESAYIIDDLDVEIIADGCHLPPCLLKLVYKSKGIDHVALTTDAMRAAGQDVKTSILGSLEDGQEIIIEDGVAKMPDRTCFAGSIATTDRLVRVMTKQVGVPLKDAVTMMTKTPVRIINKGYKKGEIAVGMDADIIMFDEDINVSYVMVGGKVVVDNK